MAKLEGEPQGGAETGRSGATETGADGAEATSARHRFRLHERWERRRARHASRGGNPLLRFGLLLVAGLLLLAWLALQGPGGR